MQEGQEIRIRIRIQIQIQIDKRIYKYTCLPRSDGGNPPPKLEARIEVTGMESRQLIPVPTLSSRIHQNELLIGEKLTKLLWSITHPMSKFNKPTETQAGEVEGRGSHQERNFTLNPRVSERTDRDTFAVCEAVQVVFYIFFLSWVEFFGISEKQD